MTRKLGHSQFCQHVVSTRTESSVPHQLGRDLACAEAGDTICERLPTSWPSAGAPSQHHVTSRTGSSRAFPYRFFFSLPYFFIFPVCQLNLKPQNSHDLSPLIGDGKHFLIPPPWHTPSLQLPPKYINISCRQFCPCISPIPLHIQTSHAKNFPLFNQYEHGMCVSSMGTDVKGNNIDCSLFSKIYQTTGKHRHKTQVITWSHI